MRRWILLAAVASLSTPMAPQTPFRARTEIVTVDVLVKLGKTPVAGLGSADFELRDNGVVQQIDAVSASAVPIDLTLLLDVSGSAVRMIGAFKDDLQQVARMLRPEDRVRLLAFAGTTVQVFGFQSGDASLPLERLEAGSGATALDDALLLALAWVPEPRRRHLVAAFTDGAENASLVDRRDLIAAAARAPGLLYVALPRRVSRVNETRGGVFLMTTLTHGHDTLQAVAEGTGGGLFVSEKSSRILDGFKTVFETFRSGYVLQYTPRGVGDPGWHELAVTLTKPGKYEIHARKGYVREQ